MAVLAHSHVPAFAAPWALRKTEACTRSVHEKRLHIVVPIYHNYRNLFRNLYAPERKKSQNVIWGGRMASLVAENIRNHVFAARSGRHIQLAEGAGAAAHHAPHAVAVGDCVPSWCKPGRSPS